MRLHLSEDEVTEHVFVQSEPVCEVSSFQSPMFEPLSPCSQDEVVSELVSVPSKAFAELKYSQDHFPVKTHIKFPPKSISFLIKYLLIG